MYKWSSITSSLCAVRTQASVHVSFQAEAEMQEDAVSVGQKVLIIDDLLATGGEWDLNPVYLNYTTAEYSEDDYILITKW